MNQLLQITTIDVKYQMRAEAARLEYNQDFTPDYTVKTTAPQMDIQTAPAQFYVDTYEARKSLGIMNTADLIAQNAQDANQNWQEYNTNLIMNARQLAHTENNVTVGQVARQQRLQESMSSRMHMFLPNTGAEISWEPHSISMNYTPAEVNVDWDINTTNMFNYVPGDFSLEILEHPRVEIEYTGTPIYFPRSADPNFEETM